MDTVQWHGRLGKAPFLRHDPWHTCSAYCAHCVPQYPSDVPHETSCHAICPPSPLKKIMPSVGQEASLTASVGSLLPSLDGQIWKSGTHSFMSMSKVSLMRGTVDVALDRACLSARHFACECCGSHSHTQSTVTPQRDCIVLPFPTQAPSSLAPWTTHRCAPLSQGDGAGR